MLKVLIYCREDITRKSELKLKVLNVCVIVADLVAKQDKVKYQNKNDLDEIPLVLITPLQVRVIFTILSI